MIEIRNLSLPLSGGMATGQAYDQLRLRAAVARRLGVNPDNVKTCAVVRRAVDARKKGDIHFVATVHATIARSKLSDETAVKRSHSRDVVLWEPPRVEMQTLDGETPVDGERPVVVGAGAAGLFCALWLAEAGCAPILVERGSEPEARTQAVRRFERDGLLDPECNIQFGAGGAGTFSDGKLTTGTSSPVIPMVLDTFIDAGAPGDIAWEAHPHIGSDVLPAVVAGLVARIRANGGEVRFDTRMDELVLSGSPSTPGCRVTGVRVSTPRADGSRATEEIAASSVVLACGHSARDVYAHLRDAGVSMARKTFAMGLRIEHPQTAVDAAQYGKMAGHPNLPVAEYKLSCHLEDGRGVYTFCMCPGGSVVAAASEPGGVVVNGMSNFARNGDNANSAVLSNVTPADLPGDDVLAGMELQRSCERAAFELGGGEYRAPAQLLTDFLADTPSTACGSVKPTYARGVTWGSVDACLPAYVAGALRQGIPQLARRMRCFGQEDAVLTGVETRSSAPVRIMRGDDRQSPNVAGLFPCGEGAGYAGGIMSAATDGIATSQAVIRALNEARA